MDLRRLFIETWERRGRDAILADETRETTLDTIARSAARLSELVDREDRSPDGRVAIMLPNVLGFNVAFLACMFAGRTAVPLNFLLPPATLAHMFSDCGARLILTATPFYETIQQTQLILGEPLHPVYLDQLAAQGPAWLKKLALSLYSPAKMSRRASPIDEHETAVILYTSGTEGPNKGVMLTHKNLISNYQSVVEAIGFDDNERLACILPTFHSFALTTCCIMPMLRGAHIFNMKRFSPGPVLDLIQQKRISYLVLVPPMYALLARHPGIRKVDFSSVKIFVSGGGPLSPSVAEEFRSVTGHDILNGYGLTEASPVVSINPPGRFRDGSVGVALPGGVEVQVWDEDGHPLSPGQVGEIMIKGPNVMKGYLNHPEATARTITPDGWLHSGDLGRMDEEGYVYITGRKKELIICSGKNIYPLEIEMVINELENVAECAVVGVEDTLRGEYPKAFVVLNDGARLSEKQVREHCARHLAAYMVPREVQFVRELPKNALGKIQKHRLKQMVS
ncbi:MAG: long-chain-fatty-acid--CoA ligase LcfB [Candidatus Sumerlaeia bacterium]